MKNFSKFLILLLTVVSVFSIKNVSADTPDIVIKDMSISEKSDTIVVNDYGFSGTTMNSDVTFYDVGDFVTYKIVLKNNTNNTYSINGLTDNNKNSNVTYEYNISKAKVLEANKELDIYITVKYAEELSPGDVSVSTGNIDIVLDMNEVINPNTSDNIIITMLIVVLAASLAMILFFKSKKVKYLSIAIFVISSMLIVKTVVAKETFKLTFNSTCNVGKVTIFKPGKDVNYYMKRLAGMGDGYSWHWYEDEYWSGYYLADSNKHEYCDNNINSVVKATQEKYDEVKDELTEENIVSTEDSRYPIYMWIEETMGRAAVAPVIRTIYYYSEADKIYLNSDASYMFYDLENVTSIDVSEFDTSNVTDMSSMFYYCISLTSLNVSGFNTSQVTDMSYMFYQCYNLTELDVSKFDTSKVTDMRYMFYRCYNLTSLNVSGFDTSKVTNMIWMFGECRGLTELDVSSFNTSNVTNMSYMFYDCPSLTSLNVSNFNTSNVTDMSWMFAGCNSLTELDVSSFDTSKVTDMGSMFDYCISLTSLNVSNFNTSKVTDMSWMFANCHNLISLNVSNFDTSQVTNMSYMFAYTNRDYINNSIISGWVRRDGCNEEGMFAV